ncbi:MAG: FecR domain-containing protein [Opitutales bacterium]|nr:FecR domain-containing protein [Opitutales bacterium]
MKKNNFSNPELSNAEGVAAEWVARVECGLSDKESVEFKKWLSASKLHEKAYSEMKWNSEELDRLAGFHAEYDASVDPDLLSRKRLLPRDYNPNMDWRMWGSIAAAVIISVSIFLSWKVGNGDTGVTKDEAVVVERIASLDLEDGSVIQLNREATVDVAYSHKERLVVLKKGEANFKVAKNENRPFVVEVSGVRLRAVGTEFNVRYDERSVDVIVSEGVVAFASVADYAGYESQTNERYLEEKQRVVIGLDEDVSEVDIEVVDEEKLGEELLWQPVLIDFENAPLSKIVAEFNRRNPVNLVIVDDSSDDTRMTSMFWSDNINAFIRLLESNFGIQAKWGEDGTIYLFRK